MKSKFKWDLGVKLTNQIKAGDLEAVAQTAREFLDNFNETGSGSMKETTLRVGRVLCTGGRAAYDGGASHAQLEEARTRTLERLLHAQSKKQLGEIFIEELVHLAELVGRKKTLVEENLPQAMEYVREHATDGVSRADVADILGCSEDHVSRLFSQVLGKNFRDVVLECRIEKAKQLLTETDDKIIDIAFAAGFCDQSYFAACFKRLTGVTPSSYRHSLHGTED